MERVSAIILAAGQGKRMKRQTNKQFLRVLGKPILVYTLEAFLKVKRISEIILVVKESEKR